MLSLMHLRFMMTSPTGWMANLSLGLPCAAEQMEL